MGTPDNVCQAMDQSWIAFGRCVCIYLYILTYVLTCTVCIRVCVYVCVYVSVHIGRYTGRTQFAFVEVSDSEHD